MSENRQTSRWRDATVSGMDEASAFIETLTRTAPDAPTACTGWTAHELVAHLAAGADEIAGHAEDALAGRPPRETRDFASREEPYLALADEVLRDRLVHEALRLNRAVAELAAIDRPVPFAGRNRTTAELAMHGRSEAALHRWDLVGSDAVSIELLSAPELTAHATTVLNGMVDGSRESSSIRAAEAGFAGGRLAFGSPGQPDVVLVSDGRVARFELDEPSATPVAVADPASRLLALWGRHGGTGPITWPADDASCELLAAILWPGQLVTSS
jgi:uncharacterized protein (TIGR03083 family)